VLVRKSIAALQQTGLDRLVVAGGVGANVRLREDLAVEAVRRGFTVHHPELALCTDNGAMIALAAAMRAQRGRLRAQADYGFDVMPRWSLGDA
jgi:N6-L-threonylcarbamoyladenine synthase